MNVHSQILALHLVTDNSSTRWPLSNIQFDTLPDGSPCAVATNGTTLVAAWWSNPDSEELQVLFPADTAKTIYEHGWPRLDINVNANRMYAVADAQDDADHRCTYVSPAGVGCFPVVRDMWPDTTGTESIDIDAHRLIPVLEAIAAICTNADNHNIANITLTICNDRAVLLLTARHQGHSVAGLVKSVSTTTGEKPHPQCDPRRAWHEEAVKSREPIRCIHIEGL